MSLDNVTHDDYETAARYWRCEYLHTKQMLDKLLEYLNSNNGQLNIPHEVLEWFTADTLDEDAWKEMIEIERFHQEMAMDDAELDELYRLHTDPEYRDMMDKMIDSALDALNDMRNHSHNH